MDKSLRPPEVILGLPYSSKVDVWILGCTVGLFYFRFIIIFFSSSFKTYHLLTGKPLVPEEKAIDDGVLLGWLIAMSGGNIAPEFALESKLRAEYFDEKGIHNSLHLAALCEIAYCCTGIFKLGIPDETLEKQISSTGVVPADDIPGIVKFVQTCLTLDPTNRPTPDDLFRHEWVQPGLEG